MAPERSTPRAGAMDTSQSEDRREAPPWPGAEGFRALRWAAAALRAAQGLAGVDSSQGGGRTAPHHIFPPLLALPRAVGLGCLPGLPLRKWPHSLFVLFWSSFQMGVQGVVVTPLSAVWAKLSPPHQHGRRVVGVPGVGEEDWGLNCGESHNARPSSAVEGLGEALSVRVAHGKGRDGFLARCRCEGRRSHRSLGMGFEFFMSNPFRGILTKA